MVIYTKKKKGGNIVKKKFVKSFLIFSMVSTLIMPETFIYALTKQKVEVNEVNEINEVNEVKRDIKVKRYPEKLQPGVKDFIRGTYFEHSSEFPDVNEPLEVLEAYLENNDSPDGLKVFEKLVKKYPDSRHVNVGLAMKLYEKYNKTQDKADIKNALHFEIRAAEIALSFENILYTSWIKKMAIEAGELNLADNWFKKILEKYPDNYIANLHYAELLGTMNQKSADTYFKKAIELRPVGNFDSNVSYVEYLIEENRLDEALSESIVIGERANYLDFLHGFILEKKGNNEEASDYYKNFEEMSQMFPAPKKYKIEGSPLQNRIKFESESNNTINSTIQSVNSATYNLSYVIACEAGTESAGGMKQVGYAVRQRVNRGTIASCLSVNNSGANMDEKYRNVICQSSQFVAVSCGTAGVTKCTNASQKTATSDQVAYDVYYGRVADAYTGYCPAGGNYITSNFCSGTCNTSNANVVAYVNKTPHSFLSYSHTPPSCMKSAGALCSNGGADNWFDYSD